MRVWIVCDTVIIFAVSSIKATKQISTKGLGV